MIEKFINKIKGLLDYQFLDIDIQMNQVNITICDHNNKRLFGQTVEIYNTIDIERQIRKEFSWNPIISFSSRRIQASENLTYLKLIGITPLIMEDIKELQLDFFNKQINSKMKIGDEAIDEALSNGSTIDGLTDFKGEIADSILVFAIGKVGHGRSYNHKDINSSNEQHESL